MTTECKMNLIDEKTYVKKDQGDKLMSAICSPEKNKEQELIIGYNFFNKKRLT